MDTVQKEKKKKERVSFKMIYPLERVIYGILIHILSLFPSITEYSFHDVICLVKTDSKFTLNNVNVEEFYFWSFLEGTAKKVSNNCINILKQILLCVARTISSISTSRNYL